MFEKILTFFKFWNLKVSYIFLRHIQVLKSKMLRKLTIILHTHCSFISIQLILKISEIHIHRYQLISIQYNILFHKFTPSSFLHLYIQYPSKSTFIHVFFFVSSTITYSIYVILHTLTIIPVTRLLKQNFYL